MTNGELTGYHDWLVSLKAKIRSAQIRAVTAVNSELTILYWQIGRDIIERQERQGWGTNVVGQLAADLLREFPDMKGWSRSNLMAMRAFAEAWPDEAIVQQLVGQLPWGHNLKLLSGLKTRVEREWYARAALEHGWSRSVLVHQMGTLLHQRQGVAMTNFKKTLPAPQSELAQSMVKDPYILDFITLADDALERDLENGVTEHLKEFLLELGKGFAFMGRQYHLEVGGQDYYLDLLFYNTKLHCHVVVELKMDDFKPEYAGKMQFYLAAVDAQLKTDRDDASIGLILCKSENGIIVEYALRDATKPIGVAEYKVLPPNMAQGLPTPEQLVREFARLEADSDASSKNSPA
jgi:predicted nuclease of restriction endonuclease-like (RecB) superfamily